MVQHCLHWYLVGSEAPDLFSQALSTASVNPREQVSLVHRVAVLNVPNAVRTSALGEVDSGREV